MIRSFTLAALAFAAAAPAAQAADYTATPGPQRADSRFQVSYEGKGAYRTTFHGEPHNPDGHKDDRNDARDSSRQEWAIAYRGALDVPTCGGDPDPCASVQSLSGARGRTIATGRVNHKHVDGIYRQLDRKVKCRLRKSPTPRRLLDATVNVRYLPESHSFGIQASSPMSTALSLFPGACPKQGDSIDRILDFYASPGFSFADGFGPERWFASREVVIPADVFHGSKKIAIPLRNTRAGTPPRRCAVLDPSFERCRTGGSWSGKLTLKSVPAPTAQSAATRYVTPRSGSIYSGNTGASTRKIDLQLSRRSIEIAAFDFKCGDVDGRTSVNGVKITKGKRGWRFATRSFGSITFSDGQPDENARIDFSGRFSSTARSVRGKLRVKSPRCGLTRYFDWSARLRRR